MKNLKAMLLVLASVGTMSLVACGDKDDGDSSGTATTEDATTEEG